MSDANKQANKQKRRRVFVSRMIQGRLVLRVVGFWFVYHFVLVAAMFLYHYARYFGEQLAGGPAQSFAELFQQFYVTNSSLVVCALAVLPLVVWDAVKTTHRIAGPLVRFQKVLNQMAEGEKVERIKLRDGDLLVELQDAFNAYIDKRNETPEPTEPNAIDERLSRLDEEVKAALEGRKTESPEPVAT